MSKLRFESGSLSSYGCLMGNRQDFISLFADFWDVPPRLSPVNSSKVFQAGRRFQSQTQLRAYRHSRKQQENLPNISNKGEGDSSVEGNAYSPNSRPIQIKFLDAPQKTPDRNAHYSANTPPASTTSKALFVCSHTFVLNSSLLSPSYFVAG